MGVEKWTEADKQKAITIAQAAGSHEASRATGIPAGTIRSWVHRLQHGVKTQKDQPTVATQQRTTEQMQKLQDEVIQKAVEEAGEYVAGRLKKLADKLYTLAEKAVDKIDVAISDKEELPVGRKRRALPHDRDGAAWLRSLVGVMAQSIDKGQLLAGKPTSRAENTNEDDRLLREVLDSGGAVEKQELIRVIRNAAIQGSPDRGGVRSPDVGSAQPPDRR